MSFSNLTSQLAVVIATKNREAELANRALRSVSAQTRPPDYVVVIDDSDRRHQDANRRTVVGLATQQLATRVRYLRNDRTPGASGAWNVGLDYLHRQVVDPSEILVAVLDDDDEWDQEYLARCCAAVDKFGLDMVAADILRYERGCEAVRLAAPEELRARDFLIQNPGIQGSNLFVRLGTLLAAGLFDEALPSTTDRDLCIRLADLGVVRYKRLAYPLVHHYADDDRARLSTPNSPQKLTGLSRFYEKYQSRMSLPTRDAFAERAARLYGWHVSATTIDSSPRIATASSTTTPFPLVIGMTTPSVPAKGLTSLLDDLVTLRNDERLSSLEIVLLENGPRGDEDGRDLVAVAQSLRDRGIGTVLIRVERQQQDAAAGLFGTPFERGSGQASIAVARTMLQAYVYSWTRGRPTSAVWILDDDMRLDNLVWNGGPRIERARLDVVGTIARLRNERVAIAIGNCTEAPPLPFASCVRTQLVDALHNLELLANLDPDDPFPELHAQNMKTRATFADYYYDLSRRETDHLETPFWYVPEQADLTVGEVFRELVMRLPRILAGEQVFRPLVHDAAIDPIQNLQPSVHRGGNAFIFDHEALWEFPNSVPSIAGGDTRRSDMVWSLLNRYGARRAIVKVPLPVRQHRGNVEVQKLDLDKLVRDIHGYALYSALDDVLLQRCEARGTKGDGHLPDNLDFTDDDIAMAIRRVHKYVAERYFAFQLSFHRAAGLARSFRRYLDVSGSWWWSDDERYAETRQTLGAAIQLFVTEYDLARLAPLQQRVRAVDDDVVRTWLNALRSETRTRRAPGEALALAAPWLAEERARDASERVIQQFGTRELRVLGAGAEAVVLTDGTKVFKCFDTGRLDEHQIEYLRSKIGQWNRQRTLCCLDDVRVAGTSVIVTYSYEDSTKYKGGRGGELRLLLDECREVGIICTNIHPDNLVVTATGDLKVVDYGVDIQPFTEEGWLLMARRVWLTGRHASRTDLKELMRESLTNAELPELAGLDSFLRTGPRPRKETVLDARLEAMVLKAAPRTTLDYGCGHGRLATAIARSGVAVTAYDPDPRLVARWTEHGDGVRFVPHDGLAVLRAQNDRFDVVVCCLVLCDIEDDGEALDVISDLSRFVVSGGRVIVAVCNPDHVGRSTLLQLREPPEDVTRKCKTWKTLRSTGVRRRDVHRPRSLLLRAFDEVGLRLISAHSTPSFDPDTLQESSDFLILELSSSDGARA